MACENPLLHAIFVLGLYYTRMKVLELERSEEILLALLRAALHQQEVEVSCFNQATAEDWIQCYRLAVRQGVAALAWEGIERLPMEYRPPLDVKLSWALKEKKQSEKYQKHCITLNELVQLYAQHGIATIVLKGVGLSRLYPVPAHREGGDIDIYTYSADKNRMTDEEANLLAVELMRESEALMGESPSIKHSEFCFQGVTFENHRLFLHVDKCQSIAKAEQWLEENRTSQKVELLDGKCRVEVPTVTFDTVFVSLHAAHHYGDGLSLKHLCDWTLLAQQGGGKLPTELDDKYLKRAVATLTQLCHRYLGLEISTEGGETMVNEMMQEILRPPYFRKTPPSNPVKAYWWGIRERWHIFRLTHRLLGVSFWGKMKGLCLRGVKEWCQMKNQKGED